MNNSKYLFCSIVLLAIQSCANNPHYIDRKKVVKDMTIVSTPAYGQTTYIKPEASGLRYCADTNVDFAATKSGGISTTFGYKGATDQLGDDASSGADNFGGRDPAVLISRELMYRACEFLANTNISGEAAVTIYAGTLDAIIRIAQSQQLTGTASSAQVVTDTSSNQTLSSNSSATGSTTTSDASSSSLSASPNAYSGVNGSFDWSKAFDYSESTVDTSHP